MSSKEVDVSLLIEAYEAKIRELESEYSDQLYDLWYQIHTKNAALAAVRYIQWKERIVWLAIAVAVYLIK